MKIAKIQYTLSKKSLDIYVSGCKKRCEDCHNPSLWSFTCGDDYNKEYFAKIQKKILDFDSMIDKIMIFGGDLLDQKYDEIIEFLIDLKTLNKEIWVFTGYDFCKISPNIFCLCDYIKCGKYVKELSTDDNIQYGISLATLNQKIYKKDEDF